MSTRSNKHSRAKPELACQHFVNAKVKELHTKLLAGLQFAARATAEQVVQGHIPVHNPLGVTISEGLQGQAHSVRASAVLIGSCCWTRLPHTAYPCAVERQQIAEELELGKVFRLWLRPWSMQCCLQPIQRPRAIQVPAQASELGCHPAGEPSCHHPLSGPGLAGLPVPAAGGLGCCRLAAALGPSRGLQMGSPGHQDTRAGNQVAKPADSSINKGHDCGGIVQSTLHQTAADSRPCQTIVATSWHV